MTTIYNDGDFNKVIAQKRKIFGVFAGVTIGYAVFCLAWLIYYISLPYADPMQSLPKTCVYIASACYVVFLFPFMGIKYHRVRKYYKMMYYLSEGLKNAEENYFVGFEEKDLQKDNVDAVSCVFKTWSRKKSEWMEREAYLDKEKPLPDFGRGDLVKYVVQSNFLIQYEIVERGALEEEEDEEIGEEYADGGESEAESKASEEAETEAAADESAEETADETAEEEEGVQ